jgi:hypothetical protein
MLSEDFDKYCALIDEKAALLEERDILLRLLSVFTEPSQMSPQKSLYNELRIQ